MLCQYKSTNADAEVAASNSEVLSLRLLRQGLHFCTSKGSTMRLMRQYLYFCTNTDAAARTEVQILTQLLVQKYKY